MKDRGVLRTVSLLAASLVAARIADDRTGDGCRQ